MLFGVFVVLVRVGVLMGEGHGMAMEFGVSVGRWGACSGLSIDGWSTGLLHNRSRGKLGKS